MIKGKSERGKVGDGDRKTLVLLDAHAILHRAYHALPEFSTSQGEPTGALYGLAAMLIRALSDLKPDYVAAAYDLPGPTYRHEAYEEYKAKRPKLEDDLAFQIEHSRELFEALAIPVYAEPGFEADDILGAIVEQTKENESLKIIIASGDMDTLQLVEGDRVVVYTLRKGLSDTVLYDEKRVAERFGFPPELLPDFKGLRGDPSDNIPGVKGVGEKTASILVKNFGSIEEMYQELKKHPEKFSQKGFTKRQVKLLADNEEEAHFSKMLATIRRDVPIVFALPERLWREGFDMGKAEQTFARFEFRTLGSRLKEALRQNDGQRVERAQPSFNVVENENLSPQEVEEIALALWLIDSNTTNPTLDDILRFARTRSFTQAKEKVLAEIKRRNLTFVYEEIEKPLVPVVRAMEERGVKIDRAYLKALSKEYHRELGEREKRIWSEAGEEFNINSPRQLGTVLFDKLGLSAKRERLTPGGMRSTRESELEKLRAHPIVSHILEYREFAKLLSTYIDNIPPLLDAGNRLHTNLKQAGTTTGRMASTSPNLQNIPIKTELGRNIRRAFTAERGFTLLSFDYSQIELRVAAILSKDSKLLRIFRNDEDVHAAVASYVFKVPQEKVDKEMRRRAKVINFGILYGMGVNALRGNLGTSRGDAAAYLAEYFKTFSVLARYLDHVKSEAERKGYTETLFGRRRYFEGIKSKIPYIKAAAERMAVNAPFQGTAADIIKIAMRDIARWVEKEGLGDNVRMILQIHDELLFEVKSSLVDTVAPQIKKIMESIVPKEKSEGIVCTANAACGKNWGEMNGLDIRDS
ncbi:hypothetical protein EPN83_03365 [Patescibacteria group bacterium]|nr:MAG: hypothetical protein EPN83_03365 [Patescibacteria group bacterium]